MIADCENHAKVKELVTVVAILKKRNNFEKCSRISVKSLSICPFEVSFRAFKILN